MNKNQIFIGVIGGALVLAALSSAFSGEERYDDDHRFEMSFDHEDGEYRGPRSGSGSNSTVEFNGKTITCDAETGTVELTHEDGSVTTVTCN